MEKRLRERMNPSSKEVKPSLVSEKKIVSQCSVEECWVGPAVQWQWWVGAAAGPGLSTLLWPLQATL